MLKALLMGKIASINESNSKGETPIHIAVRNGDKKITKHLIAKGADVNAFDRHKSTPLHIAVQIRSIELIKLLIKNGAIVNAQNRYGNTPLHLAIYNKNIIAIKELLKHGANPNIVNHSWMTALSIAKKMRDLQTIKLLVSAGGKTPQSMLGILKLSYLSLQPIKKGMLGLFMIILVASSFAITTITHGKLFLSIVAAIIANIGALVVLLNGSYQRIRALEAKSLNSSTQAKAQGSTKQKSLLMGYLTTAAS
jgi:hypothetical protein